MKSTQYENLLIFDKGFPFTHFIKTTLYIVVSYSTVKVNSNASENVCSGRNNIGQFLRFLITVENKKALIIVRVFGNNH